MRFPFFRNRDSVKNGILISIRRTGDGFHPGLFTQEISKSELAEITGISSSHMNKIELGIRNPSVVTCQKMLIALNASIIIKKENITIKEKCIEQIYNIIEKCTDEQALFFMNILDCIYENM